MAEIRIDLAKVNQQAQRLNDAATALKLSLNSLHSEIQRISSYWEGSASAAFQTKLQEQYQELMTQCRQLESVAADIRTVANRIQAQEEAAQQRATAL